MSNIENNKRIAKNTIYLYIRMIAVMFISLFTTRVILHQLGVVDYGIYSVVAGFILMFSFLNNSMSNAIQRFYNYELGSNGESGIPSVFSTSIVVQGSIALILFLVLETFGMWYMANKMVMPDERYVAAVWIFQFAVVSMLLVIMQGPFSAAIIAYEKMNFFAFVSVVDAALKLGIAFAISLVTFDKLTTYGALLIIVSLLDLLLYYFYTRYKLPSIKFKWEFTRARFNSILGFSGWNMFGTIAYMFQGQGINMVLNFFFGPLVNAAYGIAHQIYAAIQSFSLSIIMAFRPQLVQSYAAGDFKRVEKMMYSMSKITFMLLTIISIPIVLNMSEIQKLWLGGNIPEYADSFAILMICYMVLTNLNTPLSQVVHATGKMKVYQITTSLILIMVIPAAWIVLKMGAAPISVFVCQMCIMIINQIVCLFVLKRIFKYSIISYIKLVAVPCVIFLMFVPIIPYLVHNLFDNFFFRIILEYLIVGIFSIVIGLLLLSANEKNLLMAFIKKKR